MSIVSGGSKTGSVSFIGKPFIAHGNNIVPNNVSPYGSPIQSLLIRKFAPCGFPTYSPYMSLASNAAGYDYFFNVPLRFETGSWDGRKLWKRIDYNTSYYGFDSSSAVWSLTERSGWAESYIGADDKPYFNYHYEYDESSNVGPPTHEVESGSGESFYYYYPDTGYVMGILDGWLENNIETYAPHFYDSGSQPTITPTEHVAVENAMKALFTFNTINDNTLDYKIENSIGGDIHYATFQATLSDEDTYANCVSRAENAATQNDAAWRTACNNVNLVEGTVALVYDKGNSIDGEIKHQINESITKYYGLSCLRPDNNPYCRTSNTIHHGTFYENIGSNDNCYAMAVRAQNLIPRTIQPFIQDGQWTHFNSIKEISSSVDSFPVIYSEDLGSPYYGYGNTVHYNETASHGWRLTEVYSGSLDRYEDQYGKINDSSSVLWGDVPWFTPKSVNPSYADLTGDSGMVWPNSWYGIWGSETNAAHRLRVVSLEGESGWSMNLNVFRQTSTSSTTITQSLGPTDSGGYSPVVFHGSKSGSFTDTKYLMGIISVTNPSGSIVPVSGYQNKLKLQIQKRTANQPAFLAPDNNWYKTYSTVTSRSLHQVNTDYVDMFTQGFTDHQLNYEYNYVSASLSGDASSPVLAYVSASINGVPRVINNSLEAPFNYYPSTATPGTDTVTNESGSGYYQRSHVRNWNEYNKVYYIREFKGNSIGNWFKDYSPGVGGQANLIAFPSDSITPHTQSMTGYSSSLWSVGTSSYGNTVMKFAVTDPSKTKAVFAGWSSFV